MVFSSFLSRHLSVLPIPPTHCVRTPYIAADPQGSGAAALQQCLSSAALRQDERRRKAMKFFLGLLVGFGLGVVVGLVLAPQSGESIRAQLGEQGVMLRDRSTGLGDQLRARATDALS